MSASKSCDSASVITAKIILDDGRLQEFPYPIKVSHVLQKINPACFICNSDDLDFHSFVSALSDNDQLQPGQLYFALPLSRLKRRLLPEDMAALAVRASAALSNGIGSCNCRARNVLEFSGENGSMAAEKSLRGGRGARRVKFAARLSAIPE